MGANAKEIVDAEVDFSKYTDISEVKWAGWGASESALARLSIQDGCLHFHSEEATDPTWDCQFHPIGFGNNAEVDVTYTLHFKIKGTVAQNVSMLGFGQTPYGAFPITTEWVEGTVDYVASSTSGDILMQCGDYVGDWDIAYLKITHEGKEERPVEWIEHLTNGNAETPWGDLANVRWNDGENNFKICAWAKEKGRNMNEDNGWDPFPADIEEVDGSHVFVVHGQVADTEGDPSAWDNQFWIQAPDPKVFKVGNQFKLHFRYKASENATTNTQFHHQNPSDYVHWQAVGDVNFTTEWQDFDGVFTVPDAATDAWSIAFNLNPQNKNAINFYFDDLSVQTMKLDEGLFVAGSNTATGLEYDFDNAIELVYDEDLQSYVGTIGTAGKPDTWVNELMISTVRGNDRAFKSATLKPSGNFIGEDNWDNYTESSNAKIKVAAGVWTVTINTEYKQMNLVQVEGDAPQEKPEINPNPYVVVVNALERDDLTDTTNSDGTVTINEGEGGTGQAWDNQFWIRANRTLDSGEVTVLQFKYKASRDARTTTQCHGEPGAYMHWSAIGDVNFTTEWQDFEKTFTIPSEGNGMQSIAFNMAEIREACDYELKDFVWKLEDGTESLINQTGADNFFVKVVGGATYSLGINNVVSSSKVSTVTYNLAGQRVSNSYKGIAVKNGKKVVLK
jgi:hypothetical protein